MINATGPSSLRMEPPLIVTEAQIDEAVARLATPGAVSGRGDLVTFEQPARCGFARRWRQFSRSQRRSAARHRGPRRPRQVRLPGLGPGRRRRRLLADARSR